MEHKRNPEKDYWTEEVVFTTSNNSFGPTEISYLENRFCSMANEAKRYVVKNGNEPSMGNLTEEKESEMEEFIEYAKIVMGASGFRVFVPLVTKKKIFDKVNTTIVDETTENEIDLFLEQKSRKCDDVIKAFGRQTNEGFVVLSGSGIEIIDSKSIPPKIKERRNKAIIDENNILLDDTLFTSPSYAAAFVIGGHINGRNAWKTKDGKSLNDLEK